MTHDGDHDHLTTLGRRELTNPHRIVDEHLQEAVRRLEIDPRVYNLLQRPQRLVEVSIPVRMDDGRIDIFTGFRVQHLDVLGPFKGGLRYRPDLSREELAALAIRVSIKAALLGLPYGGAKGGIVCDPRKLTERELEELSRGYVRVLAPLMGPHLDIPAPDINTDEKIMGWMMDEFERYATHAPGMVTGKPVALGGTAGRLQATGRGVAMLVACACRHLDIPFQGATVAIQGFGKVGSHAALILQEMGAKVVAVCDSKGGCYQPDGLDIPQLVAWQQQNHTVCRFPGSTDISCSELLQLAVDVVVPAAVEGQITLDSAEQFKARILAEAADGAVTAEADELLGQDGVFIIPDILCNTGGVTVSYFEWVQNNTGLPMDDTEVEARLESKLTTTFENVIAMAKAKQTSMRLAAYMVGVARIAQGLGARGHTPSWLMPFRLRA